MVKQTTRYKIAALVGILILVYYKFIYLREPSWDSLSADELDNINLIGRLEVKDIQKHDKWIVLTTIQAPTLAIQMLAELKDWRLVVVGDRKTPKNWRYNNVIFLDTAAQKALKYRIHEFLPYDSYTRKMIGYLYAIEHGAQFIYETDDDNLIEHMDIFHTVVTHKGLVVNTKEMAYNPYPHFGQSSLWPRGYPLEYVGVTQPRNYTLCTISTPSIQQGLVNGDPDVDAIFRMTRKHHNNKGEINFDPSSPVIVVPSGSFSPFNSQNTMYFHNAFWALVLPTMVSDRATDIYRSYWAQKLLWLTGHNLAFYPPTGTQKRNAWHVNINDAKDERELYTEMGRYIDFLYKWTCDKMFFFDCVTQLTGDLVMMGFWSRRDLQVVNAWLSDLASIRYAPPAIKDTSYYNGHACQPRTDDHTDLVYYPWEQLTTVTYTNHPVLLPQSTNLHTIQSIVSEQCGLSHNVYYEKAILKADKMTEVLLIVTIHDDASVIPVLYAAYSIHFPHILFCGKIEISKEQLHQWRVSYISAPGANAIVCVNYASKMNYNVAGYLHVTENIFLQYEKLHVSSRNKDQMWVTGLDLYIFKQSIITLCRDKRIQCTSVNKRTFEDLNDKIKEVDGDFYQKEKYIKCLKKVGSDPTLKNTLVTTSKELSFYIPHRLANNLHELLDKYIIDPLFERYDFVPVLLMECIEISNEYLHSTDIQDLEGTKHYDYIFPFQFKNLLSNNLSRDEQVKSMFCDYVKENAK